jgi:PAS domain S-box-containing protein
MASALNPATDYPSGLEESGPVFDRATRIARTLFGGTVDAQVTLLGANGTIWRSRGFAFEEQLAEHRGLAIQEVLRSDEVMWVEDCRLDPRFKDTKVVKEAPFLRFFAGAPIRLEDGTTPGAIWVAGLEPRAHDRTLAARLEDLAGFVADEWTRVSARQARDTYERTLSAIIQTMPLSMILTDRSLRILYASPTWVEARGLGGQEVIGRSVFELRPDIFEPFRHNLERCLRGENISLDRLEIPAPDGSPEFVRVEIAPWPDGDGGIGGLMMISHDVSAMVEAMEHTERSEARLQMALQIADMHVWELDFGRRELNKSGPEASFFDRPQTYEDLASNLWDSIDERDLPAVKEAWRRYVKEGEPYYPEYRLKRADGAEVWAAGTAQLITDSNGKPIRLIGAIQNISRRKGAERALLRAKEDAEAANRAKSAFLATMSHEIRTPLNGVLGMAQAMVAADDLTPVQRERLNVIRQSGESLLSILNDVLDLSKIEAGKLELENALFDMDELVQAAHGTFEAVATEKGLAFDFTVDKNARGYYSGDPMRVRQILWNLISNGLKFTHTGQVKVRVGRTSAGALKLSVTDTGIGIAPDQLASLFRKFEQADASTTRRFGGTGLGLAICRELAGLMGGEISVRSAPGAGATFTVVLPLRKARKPGGRIRRTEKAAIETEAPKIRVLAVEDNEMNQLVLKTLLAQIGVEPVVVPNGREAVAAWEREAWDLILMDVQMPVMDGPTASALIRARERAARKPPIPIIALTANAMAHQIAEYAEAGMDGFVAKPIEAGRLYEAMQAALDRGEAAKASMNQPSTLSAELVG